MIVVAGLFIFGALLFVWALCAAAGKADDVQEIDVDEKKTDE